MSSGCKITKDGLELNNHHMPSDINYSYKDQHWNKMCTVEKTNGQLVLFVKEHHYSEIKISYSFKDQHWNKMCTVENWLTGNFSFVCWGTLLPFLRLLFSEHKAN